MIANETRAVVRQVGGQFVQCIELVQFFIQLNGSFFHLENEELSVISLSHSHVFKCGKTS